MQNGAGLGAFLRHCREAQGLSRDDLSGATRMVPRFLRALEEDRFADRPAPVFVRGYIRAYHARVGAPTARALGLYDAHLRRAYAPAPPAPPRRPAGTSRWRRPAAPALIAAALLILRGALCLFAASPRPASAPEVTGRDATTLPVR